MLSFCISGAPIFLLDTHTEVLVYYAPGSEGQPFPPPQGSLLRNAINAARAGRRMTPGLRLLRSGASPDDNRCVDGNRFGAFLLNP